MLPFPIVFYPEPQLGEVVGPQLPADWPPKIDPRVAEWRTQTAFLGSDGNQIYIHVPFCPFICDFCHFYKTTDPADRTAEIREVYVQAVLQEIALYSQVPMATNKTYNTVYFGGGTPSQLSASQIVRIINALRANFNITADAEVSLEGVAHQFLSPGFLEECVQAGVTRVSYGVESLDPKVRDDAGRGRENVEHYPKVVELARGLSPDMDVTIDIMGGLPGQTMESFSHDIHAAIDWGVTGVDVYYYFMVPGTPLHRAILDGKRDCHEYGAAALEMRDFTRRVFKKAGFHQLTGESFVRKKGGNRFMQTFSKGGGNALNSVLPLGPTAIGDLEANYYRNITDLREYIKIVGSGRLPIHNSTRMPLDVAQRRALLYAMLRFKVPGALLRTNADRKRFKRWEEKGLVARDGDGYVITERGTLWYNLMQFEFLTLSDFQGMSKVIGSFADLEKMITDPKNGVGRELRAKIQGKGGVLGKLKYLGVKGALKIAKSLPVLDQRAMGYFDRVD
jgi:coproporphyrinogen III oxidase-like Fe-S oxidoreductase